MLFDVVLSSSQDSSLTTDAHWDQAREACQIVLSTFVVQATDSRFINASVEFDLATLRPTYKLLWGEGGLSNALAVAAGLGFDPKVVQRASEIAAKGQVMLTMCTLRNYNE